VKLTPGRMAHVKVENGCVEALLGGLVKEAGLTGWNIVGLRATREPDVFEILTMTVGDPVVHEPNRGCLREIVVFPVAGDSYAAFGEVPRPLGYKAFFGPAPDFPAAMERMGMKRERQGAPKVEIKIQSPPSDPYAAAAHLLEMFRDRPPRRMPVLATERHADGLNWQYRCECGKTGERHYLEAHARIEGVKHQETHHPGSSLTRDMFEVNQSKS
jgi:hypothetical protein